VPLVVHTRPAVEGRHGRVLRHLAFIDRIERHDAGEVGHVINRFGVGVCQVHLIMSGEPPFQGEREPVVEAVSPAFERFDARKVAHWAQGLALRTRVAQQRPRTEAGQVN
jgi:hypothetical protein